MTAAQQAQLAAVNRDVNLIPYEGIAGTQEPPDWWADAPVPGNSWVCRDYVLMKADRLKALGWDPLALTVVLCYVENPPGGYHAILSAEVDGALWFLDNRIDDPYPNILPLPLDYTGDKRQVPGTVEYVPFSFGEAVA